VVDVKEKKKMEPKIVITLEITDPETVEDYAGDDAAIADDLFDGTLLKECSIVSIKEEQG